MTLSADVLADRRRIRRKLTFWRVLFFLVALIALVSAGIAFGGRGIAGHGLPHIARVTVSGVILSDDKIDEMLRKIAASGAVRGVIVSIDSPGGSTTGGEALYEGLRRIAEKKPTAATVGTLAASAGYMTAIAADHIVAQRTSITGSIGVYFQYGTVARLLDTIGVQVKTIKSAPLKAEPSPFSEPEVPGAREMIARLVDDTYQWFVDIVAERRKLDRARALGLADGSIFSGRQALELGLVDAIGGEKEAIAWLETERGVPKDLPVVDWKPAKDFEGFGFGSAMLAGLGRLVGVDLAMPLAQPALDGLVSVWHPQAADMK